MTKANHISTCRSNNDKKDLKKLAEVLSHKIVSADVTQFRNDLQLYATKVHEKGRVSLDVANVLKELELLVAKARGISREARTVVLDTFVYDNNVKAMIKNIVNEVKGCEGNLLTLNDVIKFVESSDEYTHTYDYRGHTRCGMAVFSKTGINKYRKYHSIIEIDTTFKKNNEDYPLVIAVGLDGEKKIFIIAFALLYDNSQSSFAFFLKSMKLKLVDTDNKSIDFDVCFTDEEDACINAVNLVYPNSAAFRCDWHFEKNVIEKTSGGYSKNAALKAIASTVRSMFWHEVKRAGTEEEFLQNYTKLEKYIESINIDMKVVKEHLNAIKDARKRQEQRESLIIRLQELKGDMHNYFIVNARRTEKRWADWVRHGIFHLDVMTTQATESVNAILSQKVNGRSAVGKMIQTLMAFEISQEIKSEIKSLMNDNKCAERELSECTKKLFTHVLNHVNTYMTKYGKAVQIDEIKQSQDYKVQVWDNDEEEKKYSATVSTRVGISATDRSIVTVVNGSRYTCSRCKFTIGHGIICRHYFAVMVAGFDDSSVNIALPIHASYIHNQWYTNGFCKVTSDVDPKSLIYLKPNILTVSSKLKYIEYNPYSCVPRVDQFIEDDAGEMYDIPHDVEIEQMVISDHYLKRLTEDYRRYRQSFLKSMAEALDLAQASMVPISVMEQVTANFASQNLVQCNLYRSTVIPGSNSNSYNSKFNNNDTAMVSKKAAKKKDGKKNPASSHTHRVAVEREILKRKLDAVEGIQVFKEGTTVEEVEEEMQEAEVEVEAEVEMQEAEVEAEVEVEVEEEVEEEIQEKRYNIRKRPKPSTKANTGWRK